MTNLAKFLVAGVAIGGLAAPAAAQYPYPQQQYPQQYPGYGQGYGQGYGSNPVGQIIDQLLGNRYNVTDRQAVRQCATAAMSQAQAQYRGYGQGYNQGYGQRYGYQQGIAAPAMRVTAITDVQRRSNGLRVSGLMSTGYGGYGQNSYQNGYQNQAYASGDVTFRCNVDYRGAVTNVRIGRNNATGYRRY
jgi:hypothetical protein